jgi:hypothetical protein
MRDWLGSLLMAPFIIGPIVELGLHLNDGTWHQNAFWIFVLSAMGWLWVWWVVKSGLWPGERQASGQGILHRQAHWVTTFATVCDGESVRNHCTASMRSSASLIARWTSYGRQRPSAIRQRSKEGLKAQRSKSLA